MDLGFFAPTSKASGRQFMVLQIHNANEVIERWSWLLVYLLLFLVIEVNLSQGASLILHFVI